MVRGWTADISPLAVDRLPWLDRRPLALAQAQGDKLLDDVALVRLDVEGVAQRRFRGLVAEPLGQHPAQLLQRG